MLYMYDAQQVNVCTTMKRSYFNSITGQLWRHYDYMDLCRIRIEVHVHVGVTDRQLCMISIVLHFARLSRLMREIVSVIFNNDQVTTLANQIWP